MRGPRPVVSIDDLSVQLLSREPSCNVVPPTSTSTSIHDNFFGIHVNMPGRQRPPRAGALAEHQPLKILGQIAALQGAYYGSITVLMLFTTLVAGQPFAIGLILDWRRLRGDTAVGWTLGFVWLLNAFFGFVPPFSSRPELSSDGEHRAMFLLVLVVRSKLVLDFALTLHFIHLIATALYSHALPSNALWWALQAASAAIMLSLGTWSCRWRELQPMSFGGAAAGAPARQIDGSAPASAPVRGREGRAPNRSRDGQIYQMVGMGKEPPDAGDEV